MKRASRKVGEMPRYRLLSMDGKWQKGELSICRGKHMLLVYREPNSIELEEMQL